MLLKTGRPPETLVEEKGLRQVADSGALEKTAREVCDANPKIVSDFKGGKDAAIKALLGRIMKATRGRANPKAAEEALRKLLA